MNPRLILPALFALAAMGALAQESSPLEVDTIAFGSCAHEDKPQPIWEHVLAAEPDVFLFLGDNIYADTHDMEEMRAKYAKLGAKEGFRKLRETAEIMATWDDHDYGINDAGREYAEKVESQRAFLDFWGVPEDSPRRGREGVYDARIFGPEGRRVQIVMLDTRYHRSPLTRRTPDPGQKYRPYAPLWDENATILGGEQWAWLEEQLREPAELRIIGSSIQFVAEDHWFEKWTNVPHERQRMLDLIEKTDADGVIFVSGDRHLAELSVLDEAEAPYPLYDLTSSGLTQSRDEWYPYEINRHRVGSLPWGDNFGVIAIEWERDDPLIRLQIRDIAGDIMIQRKVPLSVITRASPKGPYPIR